ncbi:putative transposase [Trichonephila clavipes]|nr:putative transposase [Trichonephila clavipes]
MCYQVFLQTWTQRDGALSRAQAFWWFKVFSEGKESTEDEPCSGRPSVSKTTENVVRVRDLVHSDRHLTNHLKGHHFGTLENIQTAVTDQLKAIPISEFHQCYKEWKKRLQRCAASEGSDFEGDNVEL